MNFPPPNHWHFNPREHEGHQPIQMGYNQGWCSPIPVDMGMSKWFDYDCLQQRRNCGPNITENIFVSPGPVKQQFPPPTRFQQFHRPPINESPVRAVHMGQPGPVQTPRRVQQCQKFPHSQPGGNKKNKNKKKVNRRDLREHSNFYCDPCDRGYKDEDKYEAHINTHEKCPQEGCVYVATGKLVQQHINLQHKLGLAKKVWSLESEDMKKWREERKKKFPTAENVEQKKTELAGKIARGEVIEEKYFGKMRRHNDNSHGLGKNRERGRGRRESHEEMEHNSELKRKFPAETACSAEKRLKARIGEDNEVAKDLLSIFFGDPEASSDDEEDSGNEVQFLGISTVQAAADSSLVDLTTTSDTETIDVEITDDDQQKDEGMSLAQVNGHQECTDSPLTQVKGHQECTERSLSQVEGHQECIERSLSQVEGHQECVERTLKQVNGTLDQQKPSLQVTDYLDSSYSNTNHNVQGNNEHKDKCTLPLPGINQSLLDKFLAKGIHSKRNQIMQCVHYIVKNNFFDIRG